MTGASDDLDATVPVRRSGSDADASAAARDGAVLEPGGVTGTGRRIPVVYGARRLRRPFEPHATTAAEADGGWAPGGGAAVSAWETESRRAGMPSFARRERRLGQWTLALFGGAVAVALLGLGAVAFLAFG